MNSDTIDLLKQIGAKFGVTVEYIWPLIVTYTRWLNVAWFTIDLLWIVILIFILCKNIPGLTSSISLYHNRDDEAYVDYNFHSIWAIIHAVAIVMSCIIFIAILADIPNRFVGIAAPEAKAIYDLLAQVTAKK